jgi:flagella basal body P-ring formation protein FlgA
MKRIRSLSGFLIFTIFIGGFAFSLFGDEPSASPASTGQSQTNTAPRARMLAGSELCKLLTAKLQQQYVMGDGRLELQLMRSWDALKVPAGPLSLNILEMPNNGLSTYFLVRFELRADGHSLGNWQMPVQAHLWQKIWVARSNLSMGDSLADADVALERRDVLTLHSPLAEFTPGDASLELAESVPAGSPLLARSVKMRPVIYRGQTANAFIHDGALSITMKVEALENGAPGQIIHVRNLESGHRFCGKVLNGQTILVPL